MDENVQAQMVDPALDPVEPEADLGDAAKSGGDREFMETGADI
jgi:hypothetical protein